MLPTFPLVHHHLHWIHLKLLSVLSRAISDSSRSSKYWKKQSSESRSKLYWVQDRLLCWWHGGGPSSLQTCTRKKHVQTKHQSSPHRFCRPAPYYCRVDRFESLETFFVTILCNNHLLERLESLLILKEAHLPGKLGILLYTKVKESEGFLFNQRPWIHNLFENDHIALYISKAGRPHPSRAAGLSRFLELIVSIIGQFPHLVSCEALHWYRSEYAWALSVPSTSNHL